MIKFDLFNLFIAAAALAVSAWAVALSLRTRKADSFARLYDELNSPSFGAAMERVGLWVDALAEQLKKKVSELSEGEIRLAYRKYLQSLSEAGEITKRDELEAARRTIKAWCIKCLLFREAHDLSAAHLGALITPDRAALMLRVFAMTREQADYWKKLPHDPTSRTCSDEPYFARLERAVR